jgi:peptidyl-prolyl cis-trans isomerase C
VQKRSMSGFGLVCLLPWFSIFFPSCTMEETSALSKQPKTIAVVNGEPISFDDFQQALNSSKEESANLFLDNETARRLKREILERLIETRLLLQEARNKHITMEPEIVEANVRMTYMKYPEGKFEEELQHKGKTMKSYRDETENLFLINKLLKQEVFDRIAISKQEAEKYFQEHQQEFLKPEEVRVRQIVTKTEQEAKDLRQQILQGASFEELAKKFSLGPEGKTGGDLGYFPRGRMPPDIERACFDLWSSRVSSVVASPYGFHLFQLIDRRPVHAFKFEEARPEIERTLRENKSKEEESFYIRSIREKAKIDRDLALLDLAQ